MKGFKSTGRGPKYGSFTFPSKAGFGPSSGRVKSVSGYSRRAPKRVMHKAVGGLAEDGIVEAPGFSDYAEGGRVKGVSDPMSAREAMSHKKGGKISKGAAKRMGYAKGGAISQALKKVTGAQVTDKEASRVREKRMQQLKKITGGAISEKEAERMGYAKGGAVSAKKAKEIAQGVIKDHVNYPAPKGHKGFSRKAVIGN